VVISSNLLVLYYKLKSKTVLRWSCWQCSRHICRVLWVFTKWIHRKHSSC